MYVEGQGVHQDCAQAAIWFRKAADQDIAMAQGALGGLYYDGVGVTKDYVQAAIWYRKAAEHGIAYAQYSLGRLYDKGQGCLLYTSGCCRFQKRSCRP